MKLIILILTFEAAYIELSGSLVLVTGDEMLMILLPLLRTGRNDLHTSAGPCRLTWSCLWIRSRVCHSSLASTRHAALLTTAWRTQSLFWRMVSTSSTNFSTHSLLVTSKFLHNNLNRDQRWRRFTWWHSFDMSSRLRSLLRLFLMTNTLPDSLPTSSSLEAPDCSLLLLWQAAITKNPGRMMSM